MVKRIRAATLTRWVTIACTGAAVGAESDHNVTAGGSVMPGVLSQMQCLLCMTPDDERPPSDGSDFDGLFGHIVSANPDYWWTVDGGGYSPWSWPPDWYGQDEILDPVYDELYPKWFHGGEKSVAPASIFSKYSRFLTDDWLDIAAYAKRPVMCGWRTYQAEHLPNTVQIPDDVVHYFVNVDAAFWAILSEASSALDEVHARWENSVFTQVQLVDTAA